MQGIIYTSLRWNKLSIGGKQCLKKSLHSSLQNQIRFTTVMVKKWGLSQSSFTSYQKLVGHQSSWGWDSLCMGTGDRGQWPPSQRHCTEPSKATQRSQGKHAGRELRGKASAAPACGCSLASWTFGQRRSVATLIATSGFQCWGCPEGEDSTAQPAARPRTAGTGTWLVAENGQDLRVPLCFVSVWPSLTWQTRSETKPLLSN